ncbi:predicted protein [Nematostella vectensis]|uniref:Thioredoxin domain-containing protein 17 n=1 Tax=Nematostella vectensis TaxID=45351 RepID=A7S2D0_NEMVE|nr:thioredoxin domain-containing protein 17 [Nematostella vectensis]EDO42121.1 predicted protein [Nematostella vectensis]|eukprot:XP_001634184.1 predicted protein [Nematostella vectensis]
MAGRIPQLQVENCAELFEKIEEQKGKRIFVMFIGAIDETGDSWCPDCVRAEPNVEKAVENFQGDKNAAVFILAIVGDRPTWKDPNNEFRVHEKLRLKSIPTLMEWNTTKEPLGDEQCQKAELVESFFE